MKSIIYLIMVAMSIGLAWGQQWNSPHPETKEHNVYYGAFVSPPKTLDPARAYSSNEIIFLAQIYEPLLQYHYLERPFALEPLVAARMPSITFYDKHDQLLPADTKHQDIAYSVYDITIKPGVYYQPHPALARDAAGHFRYHHLTEQQVAKKNRLSDFKFTGTRELTAEDFVYQIKRLADPQVGSPIYGLMRQYIVGFPKFHQQLLERHRVNPLDIKQLPLEGVKAISRYHLQIKINGYYPQFQYWLSMTFFVPMPWEVVSFYAQPGMADNNLTLDWYPVGTGPYMMAKNNPNSAIDLVKNPNFRGELFPQTVAEAADAERGYLQDAGKTMPFIDQFSFSLEKESIPRWNKFLQGYYDRSSIHPEGFEQAIQLDEQGKPVLTDSMRQKGIYLSTTVEPSVFFIGFNMLDPVVGGYSEQQRKLRQAISIVIDYEEYIAIFLNGRGVTAHGPIPPSIFGHQPGEAGMNPYIFDWVNGKAQRKPLAVAKSLLAEAGYPNGRSKKTGKRLVLNYDVPSAGNPDDYAYFKWLRKQFAKLGIELNIRATLYNRFQDKMRNGNAQIFAWGWNADYPDPENFLFLFYGPNGRVDHNGENSANYTNPQVDALFQQIAYLSNGPQRQQKINELLAILQADSPWVWGHYPISFVLSHQWNRPVKPHAIANNTFKYQRVEPQRRHDLRDAWNKPILWPLALLLAFVLILLLPLIITYYKRQHQPTVSRYLSSTDQAKGESSDQLKD